MEGESSARGMELVTRSEARGWVFASRGGGGVDVVDSNDGGVEGEGGGGERASLAASSHAARADGSTGQAEGEGSFEVALAVLEGVFPIGKVIYISE